ncbi:MAG: hypothetical protein OEV62_06140 [Actinomycetota bacterium]|nr:hypothetical protein [Actinomycetota bacterium]MDH4353419.1 hypothetical protein [Actinomycetota bacterium]MDH5278028.1 hypothetical protein [Actinomycetota bacterium]
MNRTLIAGAVALSGALTLSLSAPAMANDADVIKRGSCTGASDWKLKASPQNGRIEVEGEVDSNVNGQTWRWRLRHNGRLSARGVAVTKPPSGSFDVRRLMVDAPGTDRIGWRARNPQTGEVCRGSLRF